jgi:drug/metabolite transporter (DMT)-like permease
MIWSKNLARKTRIMVVLAAVFNSLGDVLLAKGMRQMGEMPDWSPHVLGIYCLRTLTSGWVLLGLCALLLFLVSWLVVLSWADYSYVLPAAAVGYALVPVLGHFLLGETVSSLHWMGVAIICMGVTIVVRTSPSTTMRD